MFDEVDKKMETWAKEVVGDLQISFDISRSESAEANLCIYLLDVSPTPPGRGNRLPPLQMMLRYLVFLQGDDPVKTHNLLGKLLIAALENSEFEIEKEPPSFEIWQSFGIKPQPAFFALVPYKYERAEKFAPLVRQPLKINQTVLESLQGKVSVNQIPMTNAKVEIPLLKLYAETNAQGIFNFTSLPSEPSDKNLLIRVKQREFSVSTSQAERFGNMFLFDLKLED